MKFSRLGVICCSAALLLLTACQPKVEMAPPESFDMAGQKVTFTPPTETWGAKKITALPRDNGQQAAPDTMVSFDTKLPNSNLTISGLGNWPQESWEANQEATNTFTRQIQDQILKRTQGEIVKQRQVKLDGADALELEVKYLEATTKMHGKQLYAIHNKTMWIVALNVPDEQWNDNASVYQQIIDSWKFQ